MISDLIYMHGLNVTFEKLLFYSYGNPRVEPRGCVRRVFHMPPCLITSIHPRGKGLRLGSQWWDQSKQNKGGAACSARACVYVRFRLITNTEHVTSRPWKVAGTFAIQCTRYLPLANIEGVHCREKKFCIWMKLNSNNGSADSSIQLTALLFDGLKLTGHHPSLFSKAESFTLFIFSLSTCLSSLLPQGRMNSFLHVCCLVIQVIQL